MPDRRARRRASALAALSPALRREAEPAPAESAQPAGLIASAVALGKGAMTAAAERISAKRISRKNSTAAGRWSDEAFSYYDQVGELRYVTNTIANAASMGELYVGIEDSDGDGYERVTDRDDPAVRALDALWGDSPTGQEEKLRRIAQLLYLVGEAYLVGHPEPRDSEAEEEEISSPELRPVDRIGPDGGGSGEADGLNPENLLWRVYASNEIAVTGGVLKIAGSEFELDEVFLVRIWRSHPARSAEPDSPVRSSLPVLRELIGLTMHVSAQIDSRLAGAGLLITPQSASILGAPPVTDPDAEDPFIAALMSAMITPIKDRDAASAVVPVVVTVPDESSGKFEYITFGGTLDATAKDLRDEAIRRLALGLDAPPERLLGLGDCVDDTTEILTYDGWRRHGDVHEGTVVLTLNHVTGAGEWLPVQRMNRFEVVDEPMIRMSSDSHDSLTTQGHRWPIVKSGPKVAGSRRRWTTSGDGFAAADRVPVAAVLNPEQSPSNAKWSDDFVRLVVAYTSDGTVLRGHTVRIVKFAETETVELRRILTAVCADEFAEHAHPTATCDGTAFVLHREASTRLLELCEEGKVVPRRFVNDLTHAQRELFLRSTVEIGDGVSAGNEMVLYQVLPERLEAFEYAAILTGYKVTQGVRNQQTGFGTRPLSWVRWSRSRTEFSPGDCERTEELYTGTTWCPTTANGTWMARRNSTIYLTGNSNHWSAWQLAEEEVRLHVTPLLSIIRDALTREYLRLVLAESGVENASRYVVLADTTGLTLRPDRSSDAFQLHDRKLISDDSLRSVTGFGPEDAPALVVSDAAIELAFELVKGAPSLAQAPGLAQLVAQIREVLRAGQAGEAPAEIAAEAGAGEEAAGQAAPGDQPGEQAPQTQGEADPAGEPGAGALPAAA